MAEAHTGRLLGAIVLSSILSPLNSTMIAVAVPSIARAFGADVGLVTHALVTSYLVGSIALQGPGGRIGDVLGHRFALRLGQAVFVGGALAGYLASGLPLLVAARVAMAVGGAIIVPCASALLRTELPPERRGRAFGAFGGMMGLSATVGPLLGGALEGRFGFPSLFLVNAPILLLSVLLSLGAAPAAPGVATNGPARPAASRGGFDVLGSALLATSLSLVVVGARLPAGGGAAMLAGLGVGAVLVWHERRASHPVLDVTLITRPGFAAGGLVISLQNLLMYSMLFLLPSVWARTSGLDAGGTGRLLMPMMLGMVVSAPLSGRLADAFGARSVAAAGGTASVLGLVGLLLAADGTPFAMSLATAVLGFGVGLSGSPAQAASMSAAPAARSGLAAGLLATARYLGGVAGMLALGALRGGGSEGDARAELRRAATWFLLPAFGSVVASLRLPGRTKSPSAA